MNPLRDREHHIARREFLQRGAVGLGTAALAYLFGRTGLSAVSAFAGQPAASVPPRFGGLPGVPHHAPKAKRVINLFMNGGPTHVDLFDWKPRLQAMHGQPIPDEYLGTKRFSTMTGEAKGKLILAPIEPFQQHGQCGAWVSAFLPHTATIVDDLCFVKSMQTDSVNHAPAITFMLSGGQQPGRPTLGAWLNYGLGCETEDLPAFVVMTSVNPGTTCGQIFSDFYWGAGFLPSRFQGVKFSGGAEPVLYLDNPAVIDSQT